MPIFNSLGSNYTLREVLVSAVLGLKPNQGAEYRTLLKTLKNRFQGEPILLFNGRDAIEYCLIAYGIADGDQVLTQAFSCSSIEEAINRVGAQACYFDLAPGKVATTAKQIKKAFKQAKKPKAVILQHTLGYPDEVVDIKKFCQENNLLLIADLAQAVGAVNLDDELLGKEADAVILSFGRDKVVDAVAGGAVIFRNHPGKLPKLRSHQTRINKANRRPTLNFYPLLTWLIRKIYAIGLGKGLHWLAKKIGLLTPSIKSPHQHYQSFPFNLSVLLLDSWSRLELQLQHRRKIAYYYLNQLKNNKNLNLPIDAYGIKMGTNLRFPILLKSEKQLQPLLNFLAKNQVYLHDRWYRQPVDSGSFKFNSSYQPKSCPEAEKTARTIISLPTHQNISLADASKIIQLINSYNSTH